MAKKEKPGIDIHSDGLRLTWTHAVRNGVQGLIVNRIPNWFFPEGEVQKLLDYIRDTMGLGLDEDSIARSEYQEMVSKYR